MVGRFFLFVIIFLFSIPVLSQENQKGFFSDVIKQLKEAEGKIVSLAEAVPEEKFSWRPAEGVRSVSEVYMHLAGGNYFALSFLGAEMPQSLKEGIEKTVTKKSEVIEWLKTSFKFAEDHISKMKSDDLEKSVNFFGNETNQRSILFLMMGHTNEHLGQSIAYARINGVTPPWSESGDH